MRAGGTGVVAVRGQDDQGDDPSKDDPAVNGEIADGGDQESSVFAYEGGLVGSFDGGGPADWVFSACS